MENRRGRLGQIPVYLKTCARLFVNEKQWKKIIFGLVIAMVVVAVCDKYFLLRQGSTKSGSFAIITACIWIGIFNSIQAICRERAIIKREHHTGMHISSYILARAVFEFFLCFVQAMIFTLLLWCGFNDRIPYIGTAFPSMTEYFITFLLVLYGSDMLAMMISSFCHNENTAMTIMPFVLIIQLIFSSLIFNLGNTFDGIKYVTLSYWGATSMYIISDMNQQPSEKTLLTAEIKYEIQDNDLSDEQLYSILKDQPYNMEYDFNFGLLLKQWRALFIHTVIYIIVSILALRAVDKDKR